MEGSGLGRNKCGKIIKDKVTIINKGPSDHLNSLLIFMSIWLCPEPAQCRLSCVIELYS